MTSAILLDGYGSPDVLRLGEVGVGSPGPGQIRVTVRYAGVGPTDLAIRAGHLRTVFPACRGAVLGFEAAGVVESVGSGVVDVAAGDEVAVFLPRLGGDADPVVADFWVHKPASVSWTDAAALPACRRRARRRAGAGDHAVRSARATARGRSVERGPHGVAAALDTVMTRLAAGELTLQPQTVAPLGDAARVHTGLESGELRGKVLLEI